MTYSLLVVVGRVLSSNCPCCICDTGCGMLRRCSTPVILLVSFPLAARAGWALWGAACLGWDDFFHEAGQLASRGGSGHWVFTPQQPHHGVGWSLYHAGAHGGVHHRWWHHRGGNHLGWHYRGHGIWGAGYSHVRRAGDDALTPSLYLVLSCHQRHGWRLGKAVSSTHCHMISLAWQAGGVYGLYGAHSRTSIAMLGEPFTHKEP